MHDLSCDHYDQWSVDLIAWRRLAVNSGNQQRNYVVPSDYIIHSPIPHHDEQ